MISTPRDKKSITRRCSGTKILNLTLKLLNGGKFKSVYHRCNESALSRFRPKQFKNPNFGLLSFLLILFDLYSSYIYRSSLWIPYIYILLTGIVLSNLLYGPIELVNQTIFISLTFIIDNTILFIGATFRPIRFKNSAHVKSTF